MTLTVVNMPNQDPQGSPSTPPAGGPAPQPAAAQRSGRLDRLAPVLQWLASRLRSPRNRLGLIGVILLLTGILWITNSAWTLPLIVVGIVMVIIAWVGSRLDGRFAIEWGDGGTQVEFRAQIKAPPPVTQGVRLHPLPGVTAAPSSRAQIDDGGVIEGEGHTVEIDVAELKTLIRAAEAQEAAAAQADGADDAGPSSGQRSAA
jgi:hypothetical protein